jgi:hypothetical protein
VTSVISNAEPPFGLELNCSEFLNSSSLASYGACHSNEMLSGDTFSGSVGVSDDDALSVVEQPARETAEMSDIRHNALFIFKIRPPVFVLCGT